jgi:hypothetical protein
MASRNRRRIADGAACLIALIVVGCASREPALTGDTMSIDARSGSGDTIRAPMAPPSQKPPVFDHADILSPQDEARLADRLRAIDSGTTAQVAVTTVPSLNREPIEQFALRYFNEVRLGRRGVNNGLLILIAPNEQEVRVQVGTGLEWEITDSIAAAAIDSILPLLRDGRFADAVNDALDHLEPRVRAVPWSVRYESIEAIRAQANAAVGEVVRLRGTVSPVDARNARLLVGDAREVGLRFPPHWGGVSDVARGGGIATFVGRVSDGEPLVIEVLGEE